MLDISARIEKTIGQFLSELPETRAKVTVNYDSDGFAHMKGATDTAGYKACGYKEGGKVCRKRFPCVIHGKDGGGKDIAGRNIDPLHSALGYTDEDVTDLRKHLKAIGITLSLEETEAALTQAQSMGLRGKSTDEAKREERKRKNREKIAKRRQWARDNGYCIICTTNAAAFKADGTACATCKDCQEKANKAKRK